MCPLLMMGGGVTRGQAELHDRLAERFDLIVNPSSYFEIRILTVTELSMLFTLEHLDYAKGLTDAVTK